MKFHRSFGAGRLQFDIGSMSYNKDGERQTFRTWITHNIGRGSWGISFGSRLFIGVLRFDKTGEVRERIK